MQFKFLLVLFTFALTAIARGDEGAAKQEDEIKIEIMKPPPEDCERKTKKHDNVAMHYIGTLTETGVKFDSR